MRTIDIDKLQKCCEEKLDITLRSAVILTLLHEMEDMYKVVKFYANNKKASLSDEFYISNKKNVVKYIGGKRAKKLIEKLES